MLNHLLRGLFLCLLLTGASAQAAARPLAVVPIQIEQGLVLAEVRIGTSPPMTFIVDTGAAATVLAADRLAATGLQARAGGNATVQGGEIEAESVADVSLRLGERVIAIDELAVIDLRGLAASIGRRIDGVLGYQLFAAYIVELDYRAGRMMLHAPGSYRPAGTPVPVEIRGNTPYITATLGQNGLHVPARLLVDTGGTSPLTLYSQFVSRHPRLIPAGARTITAGAILPGQFRARLGRIGTIGIGPFTLAGPVANFSNSQGAEDAAEGDAGQIGGNLLSRFRVTIDYARRLLYLRPLPGWKRPFEFDSSGVSFVADVEHPAVKRVRQVLPSTPGAEAGLQPGDIVRRLGSRDAGAMTLGELRAVLRRPGRTVTLQVERDGHAVRIRLVTRPIV